MALSDGKKLVLYLLLSTRSEVRFVVEGIIPSGPGAPPLGPPGDRPEFLRRLQQQVTPLGITPADLSGSMVDHIWVGSNEPTQSNNVSTSRATIMTAVALAYDPSGPCPSGVDQSKIVAGILSKIP